MNILLGVGQGVDEPPSCLSRSVNFFIQLKDFYRVDYPAFFKHM